MRMYYRFVSSRNFINLQKQKKTEKGECKAMKRNHQENRWKWDFIGGTWIFSGFHEWLMPASTYNVLRAQTERLNQSLYALFIHKSCSCQSISENILLSLLFLWNLKRVTLKPRIFHFTRTIFKNNFLKRSFELVFEALYRSKRSSLCMLVVKWDLSLIVWWAEDENRIKGKYLSRRAGKILLQLFEHEEKRSFECEFFSVELWYEYINRALTEPIGVYVYGSYQISKSFMDLSSLIYKVLRSFEGIISQRCYIVSPVSK